MPDRTFAIAVSPDGKKLAAGIQKSIRIFDLTKGKELLMIPSAHPRGPSCLSFSTDGLILASGGDDPNVKLWDPATGRLTLTIPAEGYQGHWNRLAFSPDGTKLASVGKGYRICDVKTGKELVNVWTRDTKHYALAYSPDGKWIASGGTDNELSLINVASGKLVGTFRGHEHDVRAAAFSKDGKYLATASTDKTVRVWDLKALKFR